MCTHTVHVCSYIKAHMLYPILYLAGFLLHCTLPFISPHSTPVCGCAGRQLGRFESLPFTDSAAGNSLTTLGQIPEVELLPQRVRVYHSVPHARPAIEILPFLSFLPTVVMRILLPRASPREHGVKLDFYQSLVNNGVFYQVVLIYLL